SGRELLTLKGHTDRLWSVSWSPDGQRLATGSKDETAKVWEAASGRELLTLKGHTNGVVSVSWSPDGQQLATGGEDGTVKVWAAASGPEVNRLLLGARTVGWTSSPLGQGLFLAAAVIPETTQGVRTLKAHTDPIHAVAWSPDGQRLATGS